MAKLDVNEYREKYLSRVEKHLLDHHEGIEHFTPQLLSDAIRQELNLRSDPETWTVDVAEDFDEAVCEAEKRILDIIGKIRDLGTGRGSVVSHWSH